MNIIGAWAIPIVICLFIAVGLVKSMGIFGSFLEGAKDGTRVLFQIIPSLVGLITAVEMFKASGALDVLTHAMEPVAQLLHIPSDVMPLALLRPVSGGSSVAMLDRILSAVGPDSPSGRVASVVCGAGETTFYTSTVYYGSVGVKKIRHTLIAALTADATASILSAWAVNLLF